MRLWLLSAVVVSFALCATWHGIQAAEVELIEEKDKPDGADKADQDYFDKKLKKREELAKERQESQAHIQAKIAELNKNRETLAVPEKKSVTIDEETREVVEPASMESALELKPGQRVRDPYEISPDDFIIDHHDRWAINISDFKFDQPHYVTSDLRHGSSKKWFGFTFSITNTTPKRRRISPVFVAITPKGVFNHAVGGFVPERMMADSTMRALADSTDVRDRELMSNRVPAVESTVRLSDYAVDTETGAAKLSPLATFEPGQTRWGAALWSEFSDEFTQLKIVAYGLSNNHRYEEKMRHALVLTFERKDDEFHVHRTELKYTDKRWEYLWMWDQDITVPIPADAKDPQIKAQTVKTPAGADKLMFASPFTVNNSTRWKQDFGINTASFVCPVSVELDGKKIDVEVRVVDDGRSNIYKAQMLKSLGKESTKDRFQFKPVPEGSLTLQQRRKLTFDPGKGLEEFWVVWDEADVDWNDVKLQVEAELTRQLDKKDLANKAWERIAKTIAPENKDLLQKNPQLLYDPRRRLSDEEFKQVREQVAKGIASAVDAAKARKTVTAYFDCTSGMSTGAYRVKRCYRQPGIVQEEWLKAWEELDKPTAAGGN